MKRNEDDLDVPVRLLMRGCAREMPKSLRKCRLFVKSRPHKLEIFSIYNIGARCRYVNDISEYSHVTSIYLTLA